MMFRPEGLLPEGIGRCAVAEAYRPNAAITNQDADDT